MIYTYEQHKNLIRRPWKIDHNNEQQRNNIRRPWQCATNKRMMGILFNNIAKGHKKTTMVLKIGVTPIWKVTMMHFCTTHASQYAHAQQDNTKGKRIHHIHAQQNHHTKEYQDSKLKPIWQCTTKKCDNKISHLHSRGTWWIDNL